MITRRDPFFRRVHPRFRFHDIGVIVGVMNFWALVVLVLSAKNVDPSAVVLLLVGMAVVGLLAWGLILAARMFMEKRFAQLDDEMISFLRSSGMNIPEAGGPHG